MSDIVSSQSGRTFHAAPPVLVAAHKKAVLIDADGEIHHLAANKAKQILGTGSPIVCHLPILSGYLACDRFPARDVLELFAFVRPAAFCLPTPRGVAEALKLPLPTTLEEIAVLLPKAASELLAELGEIDTNEEKRVGAIARAMAADGWGWGGEVLAALGLQPGPVDPVALHAWRSLPEWAEHAPPPPPLDSPVSAEDARAQLAAMLGPDAEARPQQQEYTSLVSGSFVPREHEDAPNVVLAEAGTGVGKTRGYLAPAALWAARNGRAVWISTYTRNLQRQIDTEADSLFLDPVEKNRRVVIRKGRENYLCILNMEDAVRDSVAHAGDAVALGLVARWVSHSRDGDMAGGDFPAWLIGLLGYRTTLGLTDRRGECVYSACSHYRRCFIERTVRRARRADIVIANHALVLIQAAMGGLDDSNVPTRLVFDEGHHLFDAADSAFSAHLSGREGGELRRWLLGAETRRTRAGRSRGLQRRLEDFGAADEKTHQLLDAVADAARALPAADWLARIASGRPRGPAEKFLSMVRQQTLARVDNANTPYDIEVTTQPLIPGMLDYAVELDSALARLSKPMKALLERLTALLDEKADSMDSASRTRIESVCRGLRRRCEGQVDAWRSMVQALGAEAPEQFVDWFSLTRNQGQDTDIGMHRHWVDPMIPFSTTVAAQTHGMVVTSASLRDSTGDEAADWHAAEVRTGAEHLPAGVARGAVPSPFDYAAKTRIYVVRDVRKDDLDQVAAAMRELFLAAGGGALGLFTAISRLRAVYGRIAPALEAAGLPLLAQHVDLMDTATLVDIFRAEEQACLLGTDAVRDGVDVPGESLRLIVFDRVPWGRPSILHRARRSAFKDMKWDDHVARARLKQAFGRLVRTQFDRGVFVMLDPMLPSRLAGAFPDGVEVERVGLADAVAGVRDFLAADKAPA